METEFISCADCKNRIPKDRILGLNDNNEDDIICGKCLKYQFPGLYPSVKEMFDGKDEDVI